MSDRLSQLQTSLDQLVTQFFSSLNYINHHHDPKVPEGSPAYVTKVEDSQLPAAPADQFNESLKELSRDIVTKAKQIEKLIDSMPELDNLSGDLDALEGELEQAREDEKAASIEREVLLERCDQLIMRLTNYKMELDRAS